MNVYFRSAPLGVPTVSREGGLPGDDVARWNGQFWTATEDASRSERRIVRAHATDDEYAVELLQALEAAR